MAKTIDRLILFIEYTGLSARKFDLSIGASNGYILRMKKNKASIGSDILEKIIDKYPQLNIIWLLTGKGSMINDETFKVKSFNNLDSKDQKFFENYIESRIKAHTNKELQKLLHEINLELENLKKKNP